MDTSKQLWRRTAQTSVKLILSIVLIALLTTSLAVSAFMQAVPSGHGRSSDGWLSDVRKLASDPLAVFSQRSPGARASGNLHQLKHRQVKMAEHRVKPHEQVLANVRYPSAIPDYINDLLPPVQTALFEPGTIPAFNVPVVPGTPAIPPSIVPVSTPGGGSGGIGGGGAVPEPATWLTLILGMALIGTGLRSKRRRLEKNTARIGFRARI